MMALLIGAAFLLAMGLDVLRTAHRLDALVTAPLPKQKPSEHLYRELLAEWLAEWEQSVRPVGHTTVSNEPDGKQ